MSFRSRLQRLEEEAGRRAPIPPPLAAPPAERAAMLDELRARIHAVLERSARRAPPPLRAVDTEDLPFVTEETSRGPLHVRAFRLSPAHRTGRAPVLAARDASAELLALLALDPALASCAPSRALYLDTETTGLHGGTGTIAFLVGLAFWEEGSLVVEQLLVRNLGEEAPMLARLAERIARASMLVTFNGKAFDMPLLRTRFTMARIVAPEEPSHLDLVHIARRVHKPRGIACKLTTIEKMVLGFERHDDVPSGEVSACYLHFLRTGEARPLLGVIEHNAWDVVAMAALVGLYGEPLDGSALAAEDLIGVARTLLRAGDESLRARAEIAKARGDRDLALADFEALASRVDCGKVRLELAKLYEHHVKAPALALEVAKRGTSERPDAAAKRVGRLAKKLAKANQIAMPFGKKKANREKGR